MLLQNPNQVKPNQIPSDMVDRVRQQLIIEERIASLLDGGYMIVHRVPVFKNEIIRLVHNNGNKIILSVFYEDNKLIQRKNDRIVENRPII